ncbi:MAG: winged helix-turn-helix domain-containing protein [Stellaceae bacterium]
MVRAAGAPSRRTRPIYASGECEVDLVRRELRVHGAPVPIGGRAFDFLEVLIQSAGELVTKDELMDQLWPGAVVTENALQVLAGAVRRALGPYRESVRTEARRGYRLLGEWTVRRRNIATPPVGLRQMGIVNELAGTNTNFPAAIAPLIGRFAALQTLQALLSAYRVVTLTGPGGIGKTVLALELARRVRGEFANSGWLVELASLSDPELVPAAVASVLGLRVGSNAVSPEIVGRAIAEKNLLLVLDNCEHVIDAAAMLAETLMRLCPRATILATSREVLRVSGEYAYPVAPLEVPTGKQMAADLVLGCSGPELFLTRAKELGADFGSNEENLPAVAAICRHLDGIPLAIEFAAARAATIGIEVVAASLRDRFALLTSGRRTSLPRHQTLRATLDWSYNLLTDPERQLLRRLAVFAGSFSLDAVRAIADRGAASDAEVADRVSNLVTKSLVASDLTGGDRYLRLLETTRTYALPKLTESREFQEISRWHAEYFQRLLKTIDDEGGKRSIPLTHVDNVRAALEWCFGVDGDLAIGVRLAAVAAPIFLAMSLLPECHNWSERAIRAIDAAAYGGPEEMHLQASLGVSSMQMYGPSAPARAALSRGLMIAEARGDAFYQVALLGMLSMLCVRNGDFKTSLHYAELSRSVEGVPKNAAAMALASSILGRALQFVGDHDASRAELDASFHYWSRSPGISEVYLGLDHHILVGVGLARNSWIKGYPTEAKERIQQTIRDAEHKNHPASLGLALSWAPGVFLWVGDLQNAQEHVDWLVSHAETYSLGPYIAAGDCCRGALAIARGEPGIGVERLRRGLAQLHAVRYEMLNSEFKLALVQGLSAIDEFGEALALVNKTIKLVEANGDLLHMPEALRVKGRLLLTIPQRRVRDAERCFIQSLDWGRRQGALSWQLRTALDLAALWTTEGPSRRARATLEPIFQKFAEGFDTADLKAAENLLATLQ